ncbi:hypothetical protein [Vibrio coralliilyticus]|uniref:hypothetical protein n=1 Tax=Vibrio coralliilyticus TaxID=190893 RepID=UPI0017D75B13|nr:hypothetical protein [Vibrio coralliilyticus]NUW66929.1 hypothetical protein [Vibrio coralliilyticus]NUW70899.1 hypothetical protein [Vibrio coralliilyticus]
MHDVNPLKSEDLAAVLKCEPQAVLKAAIRLGLNQIQALAARNPERAAELVQMTTVRER